MIIFHSPFPLRKLLQDSLQPLVGRQLAQLPHRAFFHNEIADEYTFAARYLVSIAGHACRNLDWVLFNRRARPLFLHPWEGGAGMEHQVLWKGEEVGL